MNIFGSLIGLVILLILANVALVAGAMWIGYRLVVSAVRTAILEADDERARRAGRAIPVTAGGSHPVGRRSDSLPPTAPGPAAHEASRPTQ